MFGSLESPRSSNAILAAFRAVNRNTCGTAASHEDGISARRWGTPRTARKAKGLQREVEIGKGFGYRPCSMVDGYGGERPFEGEWALILGASSGFGAATARELGRRGMGI